MQQARLARVIEEACAQEALLDGHRLCLLMPLTMVALRERLKPFWQQGVLLPLARHDPRRPRGRCGEAPRAVLAMEQCFAR